MFVMQHGPGTENAYGGVAQACSESVPILVMPGGYARRLAWVERNYNSSVQMRGITKSAEPVDLGQGTVRDHAARVSRGCAPGAAARCWSKCRTTCGTRRPTRPITSCRARCAPAPIRTPIREAAKMLLAAKRPVLYAGQGVHWAEAWGELKQLAELLAIPVTTSLQGKSAFPETHPLSLGSGGLAIPAPVHHFLKEADLILGIGCSFTQTNFGVMMPAGKTIIHATLDPTDVNKDTPCALAVLGDAKLTLRGADRGGLEDAEIAARSVRRREGDQGHLRPLARQMDAEADPQRGAVLALSRAVGPAEHGRHRQHHHHA